MSLSSRTGVPVDPPADGAPEPGGFDHAAWQLRRQLTELFTSTLPFQWIEPAIVAVLSEQCPLLTPADHTAAIRREVDWQQHWIDECRRIEIRASDLEQRLDRTRDTRVAAVLSLLVGLHPSRTAQHDESCHRRHAACLAVRVRELFIEDPS